MKKILLTGFEPFGGEHINASWEAVCMTAGMPFDNCKVEIASLPVDSACIEEHLFSLLAESKPDAAILCGQATGRNAISIERAALNILDFSLPDNAGKVISDEPVIRHGPAAYFASLPIKQIRRRLEDSGIPVEISNTAGTYLCNQAMYLALHFFAKEGLHTPSGFIHIPALPVQACAAKRNIPSMSREISSTGLQLVLEEVLAYL